MIDVIKVDNREHRSSECSKKRETLSEILFFSSTFTCCNEVDCEPLLMFVILQLFGPNTSSNTTVYKALFFCLDRIYDTAQIYNCSGFFNQKLDFSQT